MAFKIAVLLGGTSAERDVSLVTGIEIAKALQQKGHQVEAIDCAFGDSRINNWDIDINDIIHIEHSDIENRRAELDRNILKTVDYLIKANFDVAYIALHGGYGENGQLQALLDLVKISYTGSKALASALGMNKHLSKVLFEQEGVPTAPWIKLDEQEKIPQPKIEAFGLPVVIKPNDQGSTVGLTVVQEKKAVDAAIKLAFQFSSSVLVEKFIPGKELTVAILDKDPLPVIEIIPEHGIYDYECKYQKGKSQYIVPAELPPKTVPQLQEYARLAYRALGCRHYARVDFRLTENQEAFCLEVNTLPGMTATSLVPKAAKATGIDFPELVDKIIKFALIK